ncbi:MAG: hydroxymethylbilane synthase, partial [Acidimicrobiales bacterium]
MALEQARRVAERFARLDRPVDTVVVITETRGDRDPESPIRLLGRDGAFAAEVELAVLEGRADVAVHSAKDLPSVALLEGLVLAATPERVDVRDAFVGNTLEGLPPGALVATGSTRRRAQIAWLRPDLGFVELRGNIATRLAKVPTNGLVVVAFAALVRLGLAQTADEVLSTDLVLPQVGQGALALRCRSDDEVTLQLCVAIDDAPVHRAIEAERAFLARLGGGCDAPVGAYASCSHASPSVHLEAFVAREDG